MALGPLAVPGALEDAFLDQAVETVGEHVARDPQALLELVETAQPQERIADDQQRPALADDLQRARDRADLPLVVTLQHGEPPPPRAPGAERAGRERQPSRATTSAMPATTLPKTSNVVCSPSCVTTRPASTAGTDRDA